MNRRIGSTLVAVALALSASAALACDGHADAAEAKAKAKGANVAAAGGEAKGCDMPCCAKAKAAAVAEKPCAAHDAKGCPKKEAVSTAALKTGPAKDVAPVAPPDAPGTHR